MKSEDSFGYRITCKGQYPAGTAVSERQRNDKKEPAAAMSLATAYLQCNPIIPAVDRMRPILETLPEQQEEGGAPGNIAGDIEVNNCAATDKSNTPVRKNRGVCLIAESSDHAVRHKQQWRTVFDCHLWLA